MQKHTPVHQASKTRRHTINPDWIILIVGAITALIIALTIPRFLTLSNLSSIFTQACSVGLMAMGLTFVMITAGIDLSLPTLMALSAIVGCKVMAATQSTFLGVLVIVAVGGLVGCINGFSVAKLRMVPMIVTLAIATINGGLSNWITGAKSIAGLPDSFSRIFAGKLLGIPVQGIFLLFMAVVMHLLLSKTIFGQHLFQVGVNEKAAQVNGVHTRKIIFTIYLISGLLAGTAGVFSAARLNAAGPTMGPQSAFNDIVCATVLGGASVMGGKGSIPGTLLGSLFIVIISNAMTLLNVDFFVTYIVKGAIIILITYLDVLKHQLAERRVAK